jgi:hypothetical protein
LGEGSSFGGSGPVQRHGRAICAKASSQSRVPKAVRPLASPLVRRSCV